MRLPCPAVDAVHAALLFCLSPTRGPPRDTSGLDLFFLAFVSVCAVVVEHQRDKHNPDARYFETCERGCLHRRQTDRQTHTQTRARARTQTHTLVSFVQEMTGKAAADPLSLSLSLSLCVCV